ncbi:MAG: hypothetical protein QM791_02245 [Ferruginibacter sp.]
MTLSTQIRNWLTIGFEQPIGSLNEDFYYDKKNNEFFSIVFTDHFMLDENLNSANDVTTTYTKTQEVALIDRLRRIELKDPEILSIDRISLDERKAVMQQFVDNLSNSDLIKILQQRITNQDYRTKFDFYFVNEADDLTKQKWEEHKNLFLQQKVDTFLDLNNINIDTATLWDVDANSSISIDLIKDS